MYRSTVSISNCTLTKLTKILLDLLRGCLLTDAADEDLPGLGLLALGLGRGGLGVDLLAVEDVGGDGQHPLQGRGRGERDEPEPAAALNSMVEFTQYLRLGIFYIFSYYLCSERWIYRYSVSYEYPMANHIFIHNLLC